MGSRSTKHGANIKEVRAYIDKYVTCRMPNEETEEQLYTHVLNHQLHWSEEGQPGKPKHNATCLKHYRLPSGQFTSRCRFEFPRPILADTYICTGDTDELSKIPGLRKKPYYIERREN